MIRSAMSNEDKMTRQQEAEQDAMITGGSRPPTSRSAPPPNTPKGFETSYRPATSPMQQPITTDQG